MKFNFSMLKNENIGFKYEKDGKTYSFCDKLLDVKQGKKTCEFIYEHYKMVVENNNFLRLKFEQKGDKYFFSVGNPKMMNGLVVFSMSDTYGFSIDFTREILEEDGFSIDEEGVKLIQFLSKKKTKEKQRIVNAFR